jgi:hypothetical protein
VWVRLQGLLVGHQFRNVGAQERRCLVAFRLSQHKNTTNTNWSFVAVENDLVDTQSLAVPLRTRGLTFEQPAAPFHVSIATVHDWVVRAMGAIPLAAWSSAVWTNSYRYIATRLPPVMSLQAALALKILHRRCELLGL